MWCPTAEAMLMRTIASQAASKQGVRAPSVSFIHSSFSYLSISVAHSLLYRTSVFCLFSIPNAISVLLIFYLKAKS